MKSVPRRPQELPRQPQNDAKIPQDVPRNPPGPPRNPPRTSPDLPRRPRASPDFPSPSLGRTFPVHFSSSCAFFPTPSPRTGEAPPSPTSRLKGVSILQPQSPNYARFRSRPCPHKFGDRGGVLLVSPHKTAPIPELGWKPENSETARSSRIEVEIRWGVMIITPSLKKPRVSSEPVSYQLAWKTSRL